jgi:hypothetical protein
MLHTEVRHEAVGRFALGCVVVSLLCGAIVVCFSSVGWVRGVVGSMGFNAGFWGLGVALWCSIRLRERLCHLACVLSVPNVAVWTWLIYRVIHGSLR